MGNNSSNSDRHGNWEKRTPCSHPNSCFKVTKIRWIRVPMANGFVTGTAEVGRWAVGIATLGTSAWFNGGIKDLSHECIEIVYTCEMCASGNKGRYTAEIDGSGNTVFHCGCYLTEKDARHEYVPASTTVAYVESKFKEMGENYGFVFNNCSHWSSCLWHKLV